jgi:hypothetical protein
MVPQEAEGKLVGISKEQALRVDGTAGEPNGRGCHEMWGYSSGDGCTTTVVNATELSDVKATASRFANTTDVSAPRPPGLVRRSGDGTLAR